MAKHHFSYRITAAAKWAERSDRKWKEGVRFINRIRDDIRILNLKPNRIAVFDKTKFRLFSKNVKQVGIRGGYVLFFYCTASVSQIFRGQPRRFRSNDFNSALTCFTTIFADGTIGPLYLETRKKFPASLLNLLPENTYLSYNPPTKKKGERRGEKSTCAYLNKSFELGTFRTRSMLLSDNEASFKTQKCRELEAEKRMNI